jgi:D-glycero-D-manno-heptose 1,7-bisphosphate phosphatase
MRAIFLDRDGVICENRTDHVKSWHEFEFIPGAIESVSALSRLGLPIVVVTNQAVIGRGMASTDDIEEIHNRMAAEIAAHGGRIDRVIYCPHHPNDKCSCRKPEPGMLLQAAEEFDIDLTQSYMVGDAVTDLMAGRQVGCRTFLVLTGRGFQQLLPASSLLVGDFTICRSLVQATTHILKAELNLAERGERMDSRYSPPAHQISSAVAGV